MQTEVLNVPLNTATLSLVGMLVVNLVIVIWTVANFGAKQKAMRDRVDEQSRAIRSLEERAGRYGERIASLESKERRRRNAES